MTTKEQVRKLKKARSISKAEIVEVIIDMGIGFDFKDEVDECIEDDYRIITEDMLNLPQYRRHMRHYESYTGCVLWSFNSKFPKLNMQIVTNINSGRVLQIYVFDSPNFGWCDFEQDGGIMGYCIIENIDCTAFY